MKMVKWLVGEETVWFCGRICRVMSFLALTGLMAMVLPCLLPGIAVAALLTVAKPVD